MKQLPKLTIEILCERIEKKALWDQFIQKMSIDPKDKSLGPITPESFVEIFEGSTCDHLLEVVQELRIPMFVPLPKEETSQSSVSQEQGKQRI